MGLTKSLGALPKVLTVSGSNIGVGTTSPTLGNLQLSNTNGVTLAIKNTTGITTGTEFSQLTFNSTSNANANFESAKIKVVSTNGGANLSNLIFENSGNEHMRITTDGNIGIGTTSPQGGGGSTDRTLSINSDSGAASFLTGLVGDVKYSTLFTASNIVVLETNANIPLAFNINSTERIRITSSGSSQYTGDPFIYSNTTSGGTSIHAGLRFNSTDKYIRFFTNDLGRMDITSGGNVGIGTANATGQSSDNRVLQIYGAGFANRAQIHFVNVNTGEGTSDGTFTGIDSNKDFFINNTEGNTVFENNGSERMRITTSGTVGIGNTNPGYKLHVNGTGGFNGQVTIASGVSTGLEILSPTGTQGLWVRTGWTADGTATPISAPTNVQFQSSGNSSGTFSFTVGNSNIVAINSSGLSSGGNLAASGNITAAGNITATSTITGNNLILPQNPVGTTYGNGVAATPQSSFYQTAGGDDGFRIYAESPGSNRVRAVFQIEDDIETETEQWVFRNKLTYSYYGAITAVSISGAGTLTAAGNVVSYSDSRLKENINTIEDALTKVKSLRGVTYSRIDQEDSSENIGVIAQEIQEVLPQVVHEQENGMLGVSYGNITAVLIEAIKEQQTLIEQLTTRIINLENQ